MQQPNYRERLDGLTEAVFEEVGDLEIAEAASLLSIILARLAITCEVTLESLIELIKVTYDVEHKSRDAGLWGEETPRTGPTELC